jgi:hypothetical protein
MITVISRSSNPKALFRCHEFVAEGREINFHRPFLISSLGEIGVT